MQGSEENRPRASEGAESVSIGDIPLHSTNLLSVLDRDGTIRYQSPAIARLCGFTQAELVGISCTECFHPDDRDRVERAFENVVSSDDFVVEAVEYRHLAADGSYVWVESVASSNPTPEGYYVINTRDISERKRQQKELKRANERLERFASIVSHDLRNPLAVAKGYLDLAEDAAPTVHHSKISAALDRMTTLIESLLSNARDESGDLDLEPVDLADLVATAWQTVLSADATLHADVEGAIRADPVHLTQLFEKLFRNAVEHGGEDVAIRVGDLEDGFYVEDDGTGIPESARDGVFEAGYTDSGPGIGLGLAIVEGVVEAHGWDIRVAESAAGGARFEITGVEPASVRRT